MIRVLDDMPAGVLGFEAVDDVEEEDYANVLVPAIEQAIAEFGKVRIVYVLGPEFDEYEGRGLGGPEARCAPPGVVRADGHRHGRKLGGSGGQPSASAWPGQARAFPLAGLESAKRWAADDAS